ncbi:beta-galactosidase [Salipaludibacillus agaradhaerens]|uniref:beta-galactosidase n=1 Tax=Salipaludibacillus agaradhaerens TaxID=76935 RepID=UPI000998742F|nr:beta-galactosidase [Salipaludibacillus agaradhaerens]
MKKFPFISDKIQGLLHGADYNPEQWLDYPGVFEEDIRLMKKASCNVMSVGIFSWVSLEPEEGMFTFEWLDNVLDTLYENDIYVFLATPSGARPAWMSEKYPEVLRTSKNRIKNLHGERHNHCFTSPIYREKVTIMNRKLSERYADHPAVIGWHISNEYGGDCHCDYCQEAFRMWLKNKYGTLDKLNHAWWTTFWSHTITSWSQIESPAPHGERSVHGLNLDWNRFVTDQTIDFFKHEVEGIRTKANQLPVTTNFMEAFEGLNYWEFAKHVDVVSWDSYPTWHDGEPPSNLASWVSFNHDLMRSLKDGQPFMLMESTPSLTNWQNISKLKKPGMHLLSSLQAVAHGADTVQYFQWRKSRGSSEKLHGAVIDHKGGEDTRVFREVSELGGVLEQLRDVAGTSVHSEVAIVFDWENRWAVKDSQGPRNIGIHYERTVRQHYQAFWEQGISVDIVDSQCDFSKYKLVIAPMLYMMKTGVSDKIEAFVAAGGHFVTTYWSGIVDEHDLVYLGGFPEPLRKTLGIYSEEIDALYDHETNVMVATDDNTLNMTGEYNVYELCDIIRLEGAETIATYEHDFYAGKPAVTSHAYGEGQAYYVAAHGSQHFYEAFYTQISFKAGLKRHLNSHLPTGVTLQKRTDGETDYLFLMNFTGESQTVEVGEQFIDLIDNEESGAEIRLKPYGIAVLKGSSTN